MKRMLQILTRGCVYTVVITFLICLFGLGIEGTPSIPVGQFLLLTILGMILSFAQDVFLLQNIKLIYRFFIHYGIILVLFELLFVLTGKITTGGPVGIFVSATVLTILYAIVSVSAYFLYQAIRKKVDNPPRQNGQNKAKEKAPYTPRYQ